MRVYVGIDPTGTDLTLGHTVPLRKLRQFQDLGHQGIFVIGDMTAVIGDPSDKDAARQQLDRDEVKSFAADYVRQAFRVLDPERTEIRHNSEWLGSLSFRDVVDLASHFTVGQFLQRDNFSQRYRRGDPIWLHEFFYALMQAYDAYALSADVQIGGTEQLFNLMAGRKLQEAAGEPPQIPITLPILVGTDGTLRMSKTTGNYVAIADTPEDKFGKTMSIPDSAMENWMTLVSSLPPEEIRALLDRVEAGDMHPMRTKKVLARDIVTLFDGPQAAKSAEVHFEQTVQKGQLPDDMPTRAISEPVGILDLITDLDFAPSNSQARRLVQQGGVKIDDERVEDPGFVVEPGPDRVLQVGKRRFARLS